MTDLLAAARSWLEEDPDPQTRAQLQAWMDNDDRERLAAAFAGPLTFGTAGLRGPLGPGPAAMNHIVVAKAAAGLCQYVKDTGGSKIVVGYDARRNSDAFAELTAAIAAGAGLTAEVLPRPLPTPVLAYAIKARGADAGVVVTASHNPPEDNGYKVYLGDGMQIVPPADAEISARIAAQPHYQDIPRSTGWTRLGDEIVEEYLARVVGLADPAKTGDAQLTVVYTAMHGVGGHLFETVCERLGFVDLFAVAEQFGFQKVEVTQLFLRRQFGVVGDVVGGPDEIVERKNRRPVLRTDDPRGNRKILVAVRLARPEVAGAVHRGGIITGNARRGARGTRAPI